MFENLSALSKEWTGKRSMYCVGFFFTMQHIGISSQQAGG
jgi:hypothetical protein